MATDVGTEATVTEPICAYLDLGLPERSRPAARDSAGKTGRVRVARVVGQQEHEVRPGVVLRLVGTSLFGNTARDREESEHDGKASGSCHAIHS